MRFRLSLLCLLLALPGCLVPIAVRSVHDYEWFHTTHEAILSRVAQCHAHEKLLADTADAAEQGRLRMELAGMRRDVYFWTENGQYIQWSGDYLYSDKPIRPAIEPLVVAITPAPPAP